MGVACRITVVADSGVSAIPGGSLVYTLIYTNSGNIELTGLVLNETVGTAQAHVPIRVV